MQPRMMGSMLSLACYLVGLVGVPVLLLWCFCAGSRRFCVRLSESRFFEPASESMAPFLCCLVIGVGLMALL